MQKIETFLAKHPGLSMKPGVEIVGELDVGNGDYYEMQADISEFPHRFPRIQEIGERIPRKVERHINSDGTCCLTTPAREQIFLKKSIKTLPDFFEKIAIPFFLNNSYYEESGSYFGGEYSHGTEGIVEGYQDILGTKEIETIFELVASVLWGAPVSKNKTCYCGSGKKFKRCHFKSYQTLKLFDKEQLLTDYFILGIPIVNRLFYPWDSNLFRLF